MAGDYIPVYSQVQGKTVYVRGDQAQSYVQNDAAQYAKIQAERRAAAQKAEDQKSQGEVFGPPREKYGPYLEDFKPGGKYYDDSNDTASESYVEWGVIVVAGAAAIKAGASAIVGIGSSLAPVASNVDPNKLNHIFNNAKHNLKPLLDSFNNNMQNAYTAVQNAAQQVVNTNNYTGVFSSTENPIVVNVNGFIVHVGGKVIDGVFEIGTFFIK